MRLFGCILGLGAMVAPAFAGAAQPLPKMLVRESARVQPVTLRAAVLSPRGMPAPAEDIAGRPELAPTPAERPKVAKIAAANQLQNFLINHPGIKNLDIWLHDRRMIRFSASLRDLYFKRADVLETERKEMLPEAGRLDAREAELRNELARLDAWADQLNAEYADLKRQIDDHNARCNPAPDEATYRWCVGNAARLNSWRDDYNRRVAMYRQQADAFDAKVAEFRPIWNGFVARLRDWDGRVGALLGELQRNLTRDTEQCQFLRWEPGGNCLYNCEFRGIDTFPPDGGICIDREMPVLQPGDLKE